jgi:hypothetical protein
MALQLRLLSRQLRSAQASSLSAASGALGANVTSGRQTTASPLAVRLAGASPPCTPHCALTRWRLMHAICLFSAISQIPLAFCRRPPAPLAAACSWRLIKYPHLQPIPFSATHRLLDFSITRIAHTSPSEFPASRMKMCARCFTVPFAAGPCKEPG